MQADAGLVIMAVANPAIGAGHGVEHEAKVFRRHGGQHIVMRVVMAYDLTHHLGHEAGFMRVIGGVGVGAGAQRELGCAQMGSGHMVADALYAFKKHLARFFLQAAYSAGNDGVIRNDVLYRAAGDFADGQHSCIEWVGAARNQGLQLADDGAGHRNGVQRGVRHGGMAAFALNLDLEAEVRGHDGAYAHRHLSCRQRRPVVQRKHGFAGEFFKQAIVHHGLGAGTAFFCWLKNQMHRAIKVGLLAQQGRRAQQHGGVAVVATGMHAALVLADVLESIDFCDRQGIHVSANANAAARITGITAFAINRRHNAGLAQTAMHLQAQSFQIRGNLVTSAGLFVLELRVGMQITADFQQLAQMRGDVGSGGTHTFAVAQDASSASPPERTAISLARPL